MNAKQARAASRRALASSDRRRLAQDRKAAVAAKKNAQEVLPRYLRRVSAAIKKAVKGGYHSAEIELPGDERSQFARELAYLLGCKFEKRGYEVNYSYCRSHDIDYPNDHWEFQVRWDR